jgi:hypothetical protein
VCFWDVGANERGVLHKCGIARGLCVSWTKVCFSANGMFEESKEAQGRSDFLMSSR